MEPRLQDHRDGERSAIFSPRTSSSATIPPSSPGRRSLIEAGVIDSTGVLELVGFLEEHFDIRIADEELVPENLDSIDNIVGLRRAEARSRHEQFPEAGTKITADVLDIDAERVTERDRDSLRAIVSSETCVDAEASWGSPAASTARSPSALCARAFGPDRTLALLMPEADSDRRHARHQPPRSRTRSGARPSSRTSRRSFRRPAATSAATRPFASVVPEFGEGWKFKIVLPSVVGTDSYRLFSLVAQSPNGETIEMRLPAAQYLTIVAATNFKQRVAQDARVLPRRPARTTP